MAFEVENAKIQQLLNDIGSMMKRVIEERAPGWGFALQIFEVGKDNGAVFYAANANREDVLGMVKQVAERLDKEKVH